MSITRDQIDNNATTITNVVANENTVLTRDNTDVYSPGSDYHPATKAYVDSVALTGGGNVEITSVNEFVAFTGNDGATFTVDYILGSLNVTLNGTELDTTDYIAGNGTSITLNQVATAGDIVRVTSYGGADVYNKTQTDAFLAAKSDSAHVHTFAEITTKPTTVADYGITDAVQEGDSVTLTGAVTGTSTFDANEDVSITTSSSVNQVTVESSGNDPWDSASESAIGHEVVTSGTGTWMGNYGGKCKSSLETAALTLNLNGATHVHHSGTRVVGTTTTHYSEVSANNITLVSLPASASDIVYKFNYSVMQYLTNIVYEYTFKGQNNTTGTKYDSHGMIYATHTAGQFTSSLDSVPNSIGFTGNGGSLIKTS